MVRNKVIIFCLVFLVSSSIIWGNPLSSDLINFAEKNKKITKETAILYKYYSVVSPDKLPQEYKSDKISKSGTKILKQVRYEIENLSEEKRKALPLYLQKYALPTPENYGLDRVLNTTYFQIHYTTSGTHSVSPADTNPANSIPDYVDWAGDYAEISYQKIIGNLGYLLPPKSSFPRYRIYLISASPNYGWCDFDGGDTLIAVDSKMNWVASNDDPEGKIKGALKVTIAHEFFHAVKAGYNWNVDHPGYWFDESTSTWMEEVVFPQVNDYIRYLTEWFSDPTKSLDNIDNLREYGSCIFSFYLDEKISREIIKKIWELLKNTSASTSLPHIKFEVEATGRNFSDEFRKFTVANYLKDYIEGAKYPNIKIQSQRSISSDSFLTDTLSLNYLASHYFEYLPETDKDITIVFDGDDTTASDIWSITLIKKTKNQEILPEKLSFLVPTTLQQILTKLTTPQSLYERLTIVVNNVSRSLYDYSLYLTIEDIDLNITSPSWVKIEEKSGVNVITWESVSGVDGYRIYRRERVTDLLPLENVGNITSYEDQNLNNVATYFYSVASRLGDKVSLKGSIVKTTVPPLPIFNYPNPFQDKTTFLITSAKEPHRIELRVFSLGGKEVYFRPYFKGGKSEWNFTIINQKIEFEFISYGFPNGAYIYVITLHFPSGPPTTLKGKLVILR